MHTCLQSCFSRVRLCGTPWTVARHVPLSMGILQNTGVGCHDLLQGIFPAQGSNPGLLMSPALAGGFFSTGATWEAQWGLLHMNILPAEVFGCGPSAFIQQEGVCACTEVQLQRPACWNVAFLRCPELIKPIPPLSFKLGFSL